VSEIRLAPLDRLEFDPPAALQELEEALRIARASGAQLLVRRSAALLAEAYLKVGEPAQAQALLDELIPTWDPHPSVFVRQLWRVHAELALDQGRPAEALQIIDRLIEQAENGPARGERAVPALARLRGEALAALRRWPEAEAELRMAVALAGEHRRYPLQWQALVSLGRFYLAQNQAAQATRTGRARRVDLARGADQVFEQARLLLDRLVAQTPESLRQHYRQAAMAEIPDAGRPVLPLIPKTQPVGRPGGLTRREVEVAALVAQGKTNREIAGELVVGVRTVEAHITHILTRFNLSWRTEVALWAVSHGLASPAEASEL
jgi:ATP/maltotriose-dependent transcriptional regulator MalT